MHPTTHVEKAGPTRGAVAPAVSNDRPILTPRDARRFLESAPLRFGDVNQIAAIEILELAEKLVGKRRPGNWEDEPTYWTRQAVYALKLHRILDFLEGFPGMVDPSEGDDL